MTDNTTSQAEKRLAEIGIELPSPPTPFGAYAEAVRSGNLLFLSGTLPVLNGRPQYRGRIGTDLNAEQAWSATRLAALNALAIAREHLGSLNHVSRVVRLGVMLATGDDSMDLPKIADAASELFLEIFGPDKTSVRVVYGVASLPLGLPVELEVTFEVAT
jgi:enamine deaminase RidA (YjgF/YER057c/UK114 family)